MTSLVVLVVLGACDEGGRPDDAGPSPHRDAGTTDAGARDAGARDAASGDAGSHDAGPHDAGPFDGGTTGCGTWSGRTPIRALFVGNSQIELWNLPLLVGELSESAPAGCPRIRGERFTRGGANLRDLWQQAQADGTMLADVIAAGDYDVIVIAESIDLAERVPGFPELFVEYAVRLVEASRAAGAAPILYATPYVERADRWGFREQADPQLELGAELGVEVATGGLAWLRVWQELPDVDLYFEDRQHPGLRGSYVSALVLYAAITGASPIGLTLTPDSCGAAPCEPIDPGEGLVFQRAAWAEHRARHP